MIGVIANPAEQLVIQEFFELFKTPWEYYRHGRQYEVLLSAGDSDFDNSDAKLILIYGGRELKFDADQLVAISSAGKKYSVLFYNGTRLPIYESGVTFEVDGVSHLFDQESGRPAIYVRRSQETVIIRIGYNLFREIDSLLTAGQPATNAGIATLDLHIALLRELMVENGVTVVEIPPVPNGYRFIACLTHDVDHPAIRYHKFDHTMIGFLYRAVLGSVFDVFRGRGSMPKLIRNWVAALKLPFVYLGLAKDFWYEFDDYTKVERGLRSSFFVIPFGHDPGRTRQGPAPGHRASPYGAEDIADRVHKLISAGCEVGVHGIDAWLDSSSGRKEMEEVRRVTGIPKTGIRMHWLYFDKESPLLLENAGADYDSTVGFNETVGYRAGTSQAYKPLGAIHLLELPLHIMDTALFFPAYLDLSAAEAKKRVSSIINNAVLFGGSVTVNWHDRSIAPERCWGDFYADLIEELQRSGAWFATATEAVSWFRKRRSVRFEDLSTESTAFKVKTAVDEDGLPSVCLRVHNSRGSHEDTALREKRVS
jgi:hypothetical protein